LEKLTKHQIILLTVFVSFITSIATGIVTVSLMDQAPADVIKTIDRVVERTVEKVVPQPAAVIQSKPVEKIIREEEFVISAIEKNRSPLVSLYREGEKNLLGNGIIVTKEGLVVALTSELAVGERYIVKLADGSEYPVKVTAYNDNFGLRLLETVPRQKEKIVFTPAHISKIDTVKLGQSIISLAHHDSFQVLTGIVSNIEREDIQGSEIEVSGTPSTSLPSHEGEIEYITTDRTAEAPNGSILLDLDGSILGMKANSGRSEKGTYLASGKIIRFIEESLEVMGTTTPSTPTP